jgi:hypothetical protein
MATPLSLPQNGLRVGEQIVAEGDNLSLGNDVGVKNNLTVGGSVYTNRVITPFVSREQTIVGPIGIDCNYTDHRIVLKANPLGITFTNVPPASAGTFRVKVYFIQDDKGNRTIDWSYNQGSTVTYPSIAWTNTGSDSSVFVYPQLQTVVGRVDVFEFITFDGGVNWVGTQINPNTVQYNSFRDMLYAVGNSVGGSVPILPASYPGSLVMPNYAGTIVQTKVVSSTAFTDFSTVNYVDLITMSFTPKYKDSRLLLNAQMHHGTAAANDFSAHFMFTLGTNPITGTNILSTGGTAVSNTDVSQNVHFGGYFNGSDGGTNNVWHPNGAISWPHGSVIGTTLDLRVRGRHADAWTDRALVLNRSWGFPNGSYSAANTSTLTVMEYLP